MVRVCALCWCVPEVQADTRVCPESRQRVWIGTCAWVAGSTAGGPHAPSSAHLGSRVLWRSYPGPCFGAALSRLPLRKTPSPPTSPQDLSPSHLPDSWSLSVPLTLTLTLSLVLSSSSSPRLPLPVPYPLPLCLSLSVSLLHFPSKEGWLRPGQVFLADTAQLPP